MQKGDLMRKKILIPTIYFTKKGGIERYTVELARFLSKKYKVDILCKSYEKNLINHNINIIKVNVPSNRYLSYLFPTYISRKHIKNNRDKYFCIINNGIGATTIQDILIAQSCHKGWLRSLSNGRFPKTLLDPANLIICGIEKHNYTKGNYKKIIAISNFVAELIRREYKVSKKDIVIVHSGVNLDEFSVNDEEREYFKNKIRKEVGVKNEHLFLFVGNEFKRKGLDILLRSLHIIKNEGHKDFKLLVVGKDNLNKFKKIIESYDLEDNIIFLGLVGSKLREYYFASDVFLFPTRHDAFGLVVAEAMAAGLPVITSKFAGASEIIENGREGIVINTLDEKVWADAIIKLSSNDKLQQKISNNAKKKIKEYSWDKVFKRISKVIEEECGK